MRQYRSSFGGFGLLASISHKGKWPEHNVLQSADWETVVNGICQTAGGLSFVERQPIDACRHDTGKIISIRLVSSINAKNERECYAIEF